ncbi:MAG: undecaprenyl-diphosphate phosphatase [Candidatus Norongarragalinales archaeon]
MNLLAAIALGVIQGITEWLPVSSSGHLVLAQKILGVTPPLFFDVALHAGTFFAALWFFRKDVAPLVRAACRFDYRSKHGKLAKLVIVTTIPTAFIAVAFHDFFAFLFARPDFVGAALIATGVWLFAAHVAKPPHHNYAHEISKRKAFAIGLAQGVAVAPGVSRSGAVIGAAKLLGVNAVEATRYSFLVALPAIAGAALYEGWQISTVQIAPDVLTYSLAGGLAAAIVGFYAMKALLRFMKQRRLDVFACYCVAAGCAVLMLV